MELSEVNLAPFTLEQLKTYNRLIRKTIVSDKGCWLYTGSQDNDGHSTIRYIESSIGIHRFSLHLFRGFELSNPAFICHKPECNTPNCWNPDHLYEGTPLSNVLDTKKAGTNHWQNQTHCKHEHEFTKESTGFDKEWNRYCKICCKLKMRRRRNKDANIE